MQGVTHTCTMMNLSQTGSMIIPTQHARYRHHIHADLCIDNGMQPSDSRQWSDERQRRRVHRPVPTEISPQSTSQITDEILPTMMTICRSHAYPV